MNIKRSPIGPCFDVLNDLDTTVELHNTHNCSHCHSISGVNNISHICLRPREMSNVHCYNFGFTVVMTTRCVKCMFVFQCFFSAGRAKTLQLHGVIAWHCRCSSCYSLLNAKLFISDQHKYSLLCLLSR